MADRARPWMTLLFLCVELAQMVAEIEEGGLWRTLSSGGVTSRLEEGDLSNAFGAEQI